MVEMNSFGWQTGSDSVTVAGVAGRSHHITTIKGYFTGTGPQTGTLRLKEGGTTVWEADVSGALEFGFPGRWVAAVGASITLELTGGQVAMIGGTPEV